MATFPSESRNIVGSFDLTVTGVYRCYTQRPLGESSWRSAIRQCRSHSTLHSHGSIFKCVLLVMAKKLRHEAAGEETDVRDTEWFIIATIWADLALDLTRLEESMESGRPGPY